MPTDILYDVKDRVATLTLNRPDKLNAWTRAMEQDVRQAMRDAVADESVRVIVLTGAGRGFCAGADMSLLNEVVQRRPGASEVRDTFVPNGGNASDPAVRPDFQQKYSYFPAIPKPIIGAVNGPAVGLGFIISLYCDIRFASDAARFGTAFARRGLIAEYGVSWLLPRLIGHAHALDLLLSARLVDAQEALRMGLVNQVFPQDKFMDSVYAYAADLATNVSPRSMRVIKRQVYNALFQTLGEACETATGEMADSFECEDFKEGVAHFMEKRAPAFTGR
jgi:enoyl-CoA hydratase/carnithine racemase